IALNTWARPEAILDLSVRAQVDFEHSLIDLNPPSRKQTKKRRPIIRLTENLRGWLEHWGEDRPLSYQARTHIDDDNDNLSGDPLPTSKLNSTDVPSRGCLPVTV
ncbi:MAG: hypothetical protein WCE69_01560, partial [Aestuariivirga sp.]